MLFWRHVDTSPVGDGSRVCSIVGECVGVTTTGHNPTNPRSVEVPMYRSTVGCGYTEESRRMVGIDIVLHNQDYH